MPGQTKQGGMKIATNNRLNNKNVGSRRLDIKSKTRKQFASRSIDWRLQMVETGTKQMQNAKTLNDYNYL